MALTIDTAGTEDRFEQDAVCVLGFQQLRGANWEARPLEECPKPRSWTRLFACAREMGIRLPAR